MSGQIIMTISTQPGCGGVEIGQRLARRMSAVYVDKEWWQRPQGHGCHY